MTISIVMGMTISSFAEEEQTLSHGVQAIFIEECDEEIITSSYDDILINSQLKGTSKPSSYFNLSNANYNASLLEVSAVKWLYTNYFFHCNNQGKLYVKVSVNQPSGYTTSLRIGIFDLTTDTEYTEFSTNSFDRPTYTGIMYFSGLNPDHQYAVGYLSNGSYGEPVTIQGSSVISQNPL